MAQKKSLYIHKNGKSVPDKRFKQVQTSNKTRANTKRRKKWVVFKMSYYLNHYMNK